MNKQLEALISRAKHIVENGGLLARDTSLALIAALEQAQQPQASPLAVKLPVSIIDQVCLAAAEIHNRGNGVNDDKAQFIIDRIRNYLENGGTVEGE